MDKNKRGFTLAEILVTLGVIGVIASMTVPTLVQDIQDAQFKTAYKKAFADLNQATTLIAMNNSGSLKSLFTNNNSFRDVYLPYLNYTKICNTDTSLGNCWHRNDGSGKYLNGTEITTWGNAAGVILNSGTFLYFWYSASNCQNNAYNLLRCGELSLDVNGFKGPNTTGKDIFQLHVTETSLKPWGTQGDIFSTNASNNCSPTGKGYLCSALYLYQ